MRLLIAASTVALGLVVGIPYYSVPFFYDYFERPVALGGFGWSRSAITLGLPLGTLVTLFAGPLLVPRLAPALSLMMGIILCALALAGMGFMDGSLPLYYAFWTLYMTGWTFCGPLVHQVVLTQRIERSRGSALAISSLGISVLGALSIPLFVGPITEAHGFRVAMEAIGGSVLLALPFAYLMVRGSVRPTAPASGLNAQRIALPALLRTRSFWLLLSGSTCTIAAIGAISQHLKLILKESGFEAQSTLDRVYGETVMIMLLAGAVGRVGFGWLLDRFPKRHVVTAAFLLMILGAPTLLRLEPPETPRYFAVLFGLGMGVDFLLAPVLAAEHFGPSSMTRVMGIVLPVNAIGQTWFPYVIALVREQTGNYQLPLLVIFGCACTGRVLMALLPSHGVQTTGSGHTPG